MAISVIPHSLSLASSIQVALQADPALAPFAAEVPTAIDSFSPAALGVLCDKIAAAHPALGCRLLVPAVKAKAGANDPKTLAEAVREFAVLLRQRSTIPQIPVSFVILKKVFMILNGPQRYEWLTKGFESFSVPDGGLLLDSPILRLLDREKILLKIGRGKDDCFVLHTPEDISNPGQITIYFEVPQNLKKSLDEKTLRTLIARTIAVTLLHRLAWGGMAQRYQKVASDSLSTPIPLIVVDRDRWTQFGPPALPIRVQQDWEKIQRWIIDGALLFTGYQVSQHAAVRAQTAAHRTEGGQKVGLESIAPFWIELLGMPKAPEILSKMLGNIIPSQPLFFRTVIEPDEEARPNTIHAALSEDHQKIILTFSARRKTLNDLEYEEILELIWRAMNTAQAEAPDGKKHRGNPFKEVKYTLDDLREEGSVGSSMLKLLFDGSRFLKEPIPSANFELRGLSIAEKKIFISALAERHENASGSRSTASKKWIVREANLEDSNNTVEIIPMQGVVLIHIHGRAADLSKQDWLFLMKALDANPSAMLKISLASREVLAGNR